MKKITALLILTTFFIAHVKSQSINNENLVGTWISITVERNNCQDTEVEGVVKLNCPEFCITLIFDDKNNVENIFSDPSGSKELSRSNYQLKGNQMTWCDPANPEEPCELVKFAFEEEYLKITSMEEDNGCEVITTFLRK